MLIKNKLFIFIAILLCLSIFTVNALVITPPIQNFENLPGKTFNWGFNVGGIKEENKTSNFMVIVIGDLNESIKLLTNKTFTLSTGKWEQIGGTILIPQNLKPGIHKNGIIVVESPGKSSALSAVIGLEYTINVIVPYPGKYIEANFNVAGNSNINEPVDFFVTLINKGQENVNNVEIKVEIYNQNSENVGEVKENVKDFAPYQMSKVSLRWDSKGNPYGIYNAIATINYDDNEIKFNQNFRLGYLIIKIINISGNEIEQGRIGKLIISAESLANENVEDVYVITKIKTPSGDLELKSANEKFLPFETKDFELFLDTNNLQSGSYDANAKMFYRDKEDEKNFEIIIIKKNIFKSLSKTYVMLILVIAILVILAIFNFIKLRKYKKNKK